MDSAGIESFQQGDRRCSGLHQLTHLYILPYTPTKQNWFQWLRNRFVTNRNIQGRKTWLRDTPKHIREGAVKDFVGAYKAAITNKARKNIERFRMRFRRKNDGQQSILIQRGAASLHIDDRGVHVYKSILKGPLATVASDASTSRRRYQKYQTFLKETSASFDW